MPDLFGNHIVGFPTRRLKFSDSMLLGNLDIKSKHQQLETPSSLLREVTNSETRLTKLDVMFMEG